MDRAICHDCNAVEGERHESGCDMERCPKCGGQRLSCGCRGTQALRPIPWIQWPIVCAYCGALWPDLFTVPDTEWEYYIEPGKRDEVVCRPCWDRIVALIGPMEVTHARPANRSA